MKLCEPEGREIMENLKLRDDLSAWNEPEPTILRHWPSLRQAASRNARRPRFLLNPPLRIPAHGCPVDLALEPKWQPGRP
jgi:hypothetical protein